MNEIGLYATSPNGIVQVIEVASLYPTLPIYSTAFYSRIKKSIEEEGMKYPIIVIPTSVEEWTSLHELNPNLYAPPDIPSTAFVYRVACGHNRLKVAKDLGYRFIDCQVARTVEEASQMCKEYRE